MDPQADPLAQLRDLHLPAEPSFWPPALGWWLLGGLLIALLLLGLWFYRRWQRNALYRQAYAQLEQVQNEIQQLGLTQQSLVALSKLTRRIAISCFNRASVAGMSGQAWLEFLDKTGNTKAFTTGIGQALLDAPYRCAPPPADAKVLPLLLKQWIKTQQKNQSRQTWRIARGRP